jgi:hypothetical protein
MQTPSTPVFPGAQPEDAPVLPVVPLVGGVVVGGVVVGGVVVGGVVTHCHPPALNAACSPALRLLQLRDDPTPTDVKPGGTDESICTISCAPPTVAESNSQATYDPFERSALAGLQVATSSEIPP